MRLFVWELRKLAGNGAARAGVLVLVVVLAAALVATRLAPERKMLLSEVVARGQDASLVGKANGWLFARRALDPVCRVLVPLVLCVVLAGSVAGESENGTLGETLVRPVRRWALAAAKLGAGATYAAALVGVAALVGLVVAPLVLGSGPLVPSVPSAARATPALQQMAAAAARSGGGLPPEGAGPITIAAFTPAQAAWRLVLAHVAAALSLAPVAALAVSASTASSRTGTAAAVAGGVYFGLMALASIPGLEALRPYLIVTRLDAWQAFVQMDVAWDRLIADGVVLAVTFGFLAGASVLMLGGKELSPHR
ncbi:MAG: ABC transporter permease subunit [Planctomycetota bacterium]